MKTLILDGSHPSDPMSAKISAVLLAQLQARGWDVEYILLREQKIGNCAGDFFCWVRTPGICMTNDANRAIAAKVVQSELLVYLTPLTFGGYSSVLKRMVDHQIQNISPYFTTINGETHHQRRYEHYPNLLAIGWMGEPDAASEAVFRHLVQRNARNMYAATSVSGALYACQPEAEYAAEIEGWLEAIACRSSTPVPALPEPHLALTEGAPIQRAVLLVGSPRTTKSTSAALGGYLMERLAERGVATRTIQIYTTLHSAARMQELIAALDAADLIVLAFPLYVDSLPAPVIAALETIATHREGQQSRQRFAALANCGFPEAQHTANALAVCELFARQAGFAWAGSLALGAGEGLIHGRPLHELGGRVGAVRKGLELAAAALAAGNAIPGAAANLLAKPIIRPWQYALLGRFGWKQQAKRYAAHKYLRRQPYQTTGM
jgi:multimeric flavodoxin WrbA